MTSSQSNALWAWCWPHVNFTWPCCLLKKGTHSTIYYFFFQKDSSIVSLHLHCIFSQRCVHPPVLVPKSAISREGDTEDHPLIVSCPKQEFLPFFSINMLQHQTHLNLSSKRLKTVGSWPVPCWGEANIFISFWKTTNEWHMATFSSWNLILIPQCISMEIAENNIWKFLKKGLSSSSCQIKGKTCLKMTMRTQDSVLTD